MFEHIAFNKEAERIQLPENHNYLSSYPLFIDFFRKKHRLSFSDVVIGCNLVYGWMPTSFKMKHEFSSSMPDAIRYLNAVKQATVLTEQEFETIAKVVNNSIVSSSKLLHFINPELYPIWDSRICRLIHGTGSHYKVSQIRNYLQYQTGCLEFISKNQLDVAFSLVQQALKKANYDYTVSDIRAFEMILFYTSAR